MTTRRLLKALGVAVVFILFIQAIEAKAQTHDSVGLSVVPAIIDQPLAPGISTTISIQVTNITDKSLPVRVGTRPLAPLDPLVDENLRDRYDASSWLDVLTPQLVLAPGQTESVQLVARANDEAGPGGHYALVVFRILTNETAVSTNSARFNPEVASVVMFALPGQINEQMHLRLDQPPLWQVSSVASSFAYLANRGNVHVLPQINASFAPIGGGTRADISVPPHLVLPGTESRFDLEWPKLEWGLYRLQVETSFGTPLKSLSATSRWFFVPPPFWIQAVAAIVVLAAIWATGKLLKKARSFRRRRRRLASDRSDLVGRANEPGELDYLGRDEGVTDISRRRRRPPGS